MNEYAMNIIFKRALIIGLCSITIATASYQFSAHSQERAPTVPQFWLVTTTEINASIGPLLENYIDDITPVLRAKMPNIQVQRQAISLNLDQGPNQQAAQVITQLENAFHEQGLIGAFVVGLPLPEVEIGDQKTHSVLPYGDFDNKYFSFSQLTNTFTHNEESTDVVSRTDIMLGYLPDLGTEGLTTYFNTHHNYSTGILGYNRALLYNDPIGDTKLRSSLQETLLSPVSSQAFDPSAFQNALQSNNKPWQEALSGTKRWQPGLSLNSNEIMTSLDSWYNEPALETLHNLLPAIADYFLELPPTLDTAIIAEQENSIGTLLSSIGAFSSPIAIKQRFFSNRSLENAVCNLENPFPATDSDDFRTFRSQFNALQTWFGTLPRGSLLAKAPDGISVLVNGTTMGQYFIIRPGDFVSAASSEPVTLKTIVIDPAAIRKDLEIPRTGFNHPGLTEGELPSWTILEITNEQINELIGWNYFLSKDEQYRYLVKNRLPPLNQFAAAPNTFEIAVNILDQSLANGFTDTCLETRTATTRSLLTLFIGFNAVDDNKLLLQELASGKSLAIIATNSTQQSKNASFDSMTNVQFSGLANPPLLTSFAGGDMLGKSIASGSNEIVNLFGDPCLILR